MASLNLTWLEFKGYWQKSIGFWFNASGKRVPRRFIFKHSNDAEGRRKAESELLPILADWQKIKADAKKAGNEPVWYRKQMEAVPTTLPSTDTPEGKKFWALPIGSPERVALVKRVMASKANKGANPTPPLSEMTIEQAVKAFQNWKRSTGIKGTSVESMASRLAQALNGHDTTLPMRTFNPSEPVDRLIIESGAGKIRGRTAQNYAKEIKVLCEWYVSKVDGYHLPKDWRNMFRISRFKNHKAEEEVFSDDAEEFDFEIYSDEDIATILKACRRNRPKLYVLLALQAAMYYVDICDFRRANVRLDSDKPFLLYKRVKEGHREPIIQKVWLWPETADILRAELSPEGSKFALLSEDGEPMKRKGPMETWKRLRIKLVKLLPQRKKIRFTDFRKTGGSAIANLSSVDLGDLHLGHKIKGVGNRYMKLQKKRLYAPMMAWRKQLIAAGAL